MSDVNGEEGRTYCPACLGHGTNVHECEELLSAVVRASDLRHLLDVYIENGMVDADDEDIVARLYHAAHTTDNGS